jgi:outer membrane protein assembly factor BamE (lipoprotein component of BamABCDE complex)
MRYIQQNAKWFVLGCCLAVSACVSQEEKRGYAIEFARLEEVKAGQSTKEDVQAALGSPSTRATYGQETWYYVNQQMKVAALSKPELVGEETIVVKFREDGVVDSVVRNKGEDRKDIAIAKDKTITEGNSMTVMEQLLGNLGKFNSPQGVRAGKTHSGASTRH